MLDLALADQKTAAFRKRVSPRELAHYRADIEALEPGDGETSSLLHAQVAAGALAARARASLAHVLADVRDDAKLVFRGDVGKQRAFGHGSRIATDASSALRVLAHGVIAAAAKSPSTPRRSASTSRA